MFPHKGTSGNSIFVMIARHFRADNCKDTGGRETQAAKAGEGSLSGINDRLSTKITKRGREQWISGGAHKLFQRTCAIVSGSAHKSIRSNNPVRTNKVNTLLQVLLGAIALTSTCYADVRLPKLISDGLVIQRDQPLRIWGWADEGEAVVVRIGEQTKSAVTHKGVWSVNFKAMPANSQFNIEIQGKNHLQVKDVVAGDVWLAAGQSNMETNLKRVAPQYPNLIANTRLPLIREFRVPVVYSFKGPQEDFPQGKWKTATPENLAEFSAVGFFFARQIHLTYSVPIGIVVIAVGGSPAEAWISTEGLKNYPEHLATFQKFTDEKLLNTILSEDKAKVDAWFNQVNNADLGMQAKPNWSAADVQFNTWPTMTVPGSFQSQGIKLNNGVAWLKKNITLNAQHGQHAQQQGATLWLGVIVDSDNVFINGQPVGQTGYRYPPRIYSIKPGILKAGVNNITIRLTSNSAEPEFVLDKRYALQLGDQQVNLTGPWHYKIGALAGDYPTTLTPHYQPASLYNAKLAPVLNTPIKGILWYQGESNVKRADEYFRLFPTLINDWRKQFARKDLPFLYVQLPNFKAAHNQPQESEWAQLRQAQLHALKLPHTAMAVAIDLGEWNDIHPLNKQPVGERLALLARQKVYGERKLIAQSPLAAAAVRKKNTVVVRFNTANDELALCFGNTLNHIAIAGADKKFTWAKAVINKNTLVVDSAEVKQPKYVRYAWAENPQGANLCGEGNLPASPFELPIK